MALCLITNVSAQVSQEDLFDTVCRIKTEDGVGSGWVFEETETTSYIMTCFHVVENSQATVQFQRDGFMSEAVPVETVYKSFDPYKRDLAILALEKKKLGGLVPKVLPLLSNDNVNWDTPTIYTVGHANGSVHPSMFIGTIIKTGQPGLHFQPPPKGGRSGSPVVGYKKSTGERFAIGMIGWRNEETGLGRAMSIDQVYAILRGEDTVIGSPLNNYTGTAVQYTQQCPPGKQCPPFYGMFKGKQTPKVSDGIINPNNPWISTPGKVPGPPLIVNNYEQRIAALEAISKTNAATIKANKATVDKVLTVAESVKAQLAALGVNIDDKLKNYAQRDPSGNYVTEAQLLTNQTSTTDAVTNIVATKVGNFTTDVNDRLKKVGLAQTEVSTRLDEQSGQQSKIDAKLEKVAETATKLAPLLNFIPGWGTVASVGATGIGGLVLAWTRRKKKPIDAINQGGVGYQYPLPVVNPQVPAQPDMAAAMELIRREMAANRPPEQPTPQAPIEPPYVAPVQTFNMQPPARPTEINYTVAPNNNDELHFRQAMEAVSKRYPWTGQAISLIEKAYPIYKSGVR